MIKLCRLIKRRERMTKQDFAAWWLRDHAPRAVALKGLKRYQIDLTVGEEEAPWDGMAELWFESVESMTAAFETELGKELAADSTAHASERNGIVVEEHPVI